MRFNSKKFRVLIEPSCGAVDGLAGLKWVGGVEWSAGRKEGRKEGREGGRKGGRKDEEEDVRRKKKEEEDEKGRGMMMATRI